MKGLLCKDWAILVNSYKKNFLIMVVLYLGMAVCLHMKKRSRPCAGTFFVRTAKESRLPGSLRGEKERSCAAPSGSGPNLRDRPQCPKGKRRLLCKRYAVVQSHT